MSRDVSGHTLVRPIGRIGILDLVTWERPDVARQVLCCGAVMGIDGTLRIWEPVTSRQLVSSSHDALMRLQVRWIENTRRVIVAAGDGAEIWDIDRDTERCGSSKHS